MATRWRHGWPPASGPAPLRRRPRPRRRAWPARGHALRGRLRFAAAGGGPGPALSAFCHDSGIGFAHEPIAAGPDKAAAQLTGAPALVARIDWPGRVPTGDAVGCHRALCPQVLAAGGDSLVLVTEHQGTRHDDLRLVCDPPAMVPAALTDRRVARTSERGHGRRAERRDLLASPDLNGSLEWPGVQQLFRLERTWRERGTARQARHYGITSLAAAEADPARLLTLRRGNGGSETRLHRHKDVTFGEDASLIQGGEEPPVLALVRDAAVSLLHQAGVRQIAARLRTHSQQPARALALVLGPLPTGA